MSISNLGIIPAAGGLQQGTFVPSISGLINITNITDAEVYWTKIGRQYNVSIRMLVDVTAIALTASATISLEDIPGMPTLPSEQLAGTARQQIAVGEFVAAQIIGGGTNVVTVFGVPSLGGPSAIFTAQFSFLGA